MDPAPLSRSFAVMTLDVATERYGLDGQLRERVTRRLQGKACRSLPTDGLAYGIADIEEAILLEREVDICPLCGTPGRPGSQRCPLCLTCFSCDG